MLVFILAFVLFSIGLYGITRKRNIIKIIIGILIAEYSINLLFVLIGYRMNGRSPILSQTDEIKQMVDPLPQAIVLISLVIGLALAAVSVAIAVRMYERYGTFDITKIRRLKG